MSVNQWAGQSTLQGRMWHHWNADLKRRMADLGGGHEFTDEALEQRDRVAVTEVLIDHMLAIEERRRQRTETTWPDESDIYADTIKRLRVLFSRKIETEAAVDAVAQAVAKERCMNQVYMDGRHNVNAKDQRQAREYVTVALYALPAGALLDVAGEVETPCATCGDRRTVKRFRGMAGPITTEPCPDCGVETPEAVEAGAKIYACWRQGVELDDDFPYWMTGPFAASVENARLFLPAVYEVWRADLIAQGWTPPGGTE